MKICYLILAHKNPEQLNLLVKKLLCDENAIIYMHISIPQYYELINRIITHDRLHIISNPIKVDWGGDNILRAQLLLLKDSIGEKADYYQFITGQDFPIRNDLHDYLCSCPEQVFMDAEYSHKEEKVRLEYKWPYILSKMYNNKANIYRVIRKLRIILLQHGFPGIKKQIPKKYRNIKYYKSMFWVTIDYETAEYVLKYLADNPDYFALFENALNAEEGFWATTIMNDENLKSKVKTCNTLVYVGDFINNHPRTITLDDKDKLESSGMFFARKFDMQVDCEIIDYFYNKKEK